MSALPPWNAKLARASCRGRTCSKARFRSAITFELVFLPRPGPAGCDGRRHASHIMRKSSTRRMIWHIRDWSETYGFNIIWQTCTATTHESARGQETRHVCRASKNDQDLRPADTSPCVYCVAACVWMQCKMALHLAVLSAPRAPPSGMLEAVSWIARFLQGREAGSPWSRLAREEVHGHDGWGMEG